MVNICNTCSDRLRKNSSRFNCKKECIFNEKYKSGILHKKAQAKIKCYLETEGNELIILRHGPDCRFPVSIKLKDGMSVELEYEYTPSDPISNKRYCDVAILENGKIKYIIEICNTSRTKHANRIDFQEYWFELDVETCLNLNFNKPKEKVISISEYHCDCLGLVKDIEHNKKIFIKQSCAGSGKTYGAVRLFKESENKYNKFIYISKTNSSIQTIHEEFLNMKDPGVVVIPDSKEIQELIPVKPKYANWDTNRTYDDDEIETETETKIDSNIIKIQREVCYDHEATKNDTIEQNDNNTSHNYRSRNLVVKYNNKEFIINIMTMDSFYYGLLKNSTVNSGLTIDFFGTNAKNIGYYNLNNKYKLDKNTQIIVDECQDIDVYNDKPFFNIIDTFGCDMYLIGDKLQSIFKTNNVFVSLYDIYHSNTEVLDQYQRMLKSKIIILEPVTQIRRFENTDSLTFLEEVISDNKYIKYKLPKPNAIHDKKRYTKPNETFTYNINDFDDKRCVIKEYENIIDNFIIPDMNDIIETYSGNENEFPYPEEFSFIFSYVNNNKLANILKEKISLYWKEHKNEKIRKHINQTESLCFIHRSTEGQPIDFSESKNSSRILSIHSSKGRSLNYVYLMTHEDSVLRKIYTRNIHDEYGKQLMVDSLINVAYTRHRKRLVVFKNTYDRINFIKPVNFIYNFIARDQKYKFKVNDSIIEKTMSKFLLEDIFPKVMHVNKTDNVFNYGLVDMTYHDIANELARQKILKGLFEPTNYGFTKSIISYYLNVLQKLHQIEFKYCKKVSANKSIRDAFRKHMRCWEVKNTNCRICEGDKFVLYLPNSVDSLDQFKEILKELQSGYDELSSTLFRKESGFFFILNFIVGILRGKNPSFSELIDVLKAYYTNKLPGKLLNRLDDVCDITKKITKDIQINDNTTTKLKIKETNSKSKFGTISQTDNYVANFTNAENDETRFLLSYAKDISSNLGQRKIEHYVKKILCSELISEYYITLVDDEFIKFTIDEDINDDIINVYRNLKIYLLYTFIMSDEYYDSETKPVFDVDAKPHKFSHKVYLDNKTKNDWGDYRTWLSHEFIAEYFGRGNFGNKCSEKCKCKKKIDKLENKLFAQ